MSLSRSLLLVSATVLLLMVLAGCGGGSKSDNDSTIRTYSSSDDGFSIRFPRPWSIAENTRGMAVVGTSPMEGSEDTYRENAGVVSVELESPMTLETYHLSNIGALTLECANFNLLEEGDTTIDGSTAKWLLFTYTSGGQELQCLEYEKLRYGRAYVVICTALPTSYTGYASLFEEIGLSLDLYDPRSPEVSGSATRDAQSLSPCIRALISAAK